MQVRIDPENGQLFENWLDFWNYWALTMPDSAVVGMAWDKLPIIEVENLEEARKKLSFIYEESVSILDTMKAQQIMYNVLMNKLNNIIYECDNNSNDRSLSPCNDLGRNDIQ